MPKWWKFSKSGHSGNYSTPEQITIIGFCKSHDRWWIRVHYLQSVVVILLTNLFTWWLQDPACRLRRLNEVSPQICNWRLQNDRRSGHRKRSAKRLRRIKFVWNCKEHSSRIVLMTGVQQDWPETKQQCDKIWRNFAALVKSSKAWVIFWGFIYNWAKILDLL